MITVVARHWPAKPNMAPNKAGRRTSGLAHLFTHTRLSREMRNLVPIFVTTNGFVSAFRVQAIKAQALAGYSEWRPEGCTLNGCTQNRNNARSSGEDTAPSSLTTSFKGACPCVAIHSTLIQLLRNYCSEDVREGLVFDSLHYSAAVSSTRGQKISIQVL